jgi:signal transduction histidine kinase
MTVADIKVYPFLHRLQPYFFAFTIGLILVILLVTVLGYVLALSITTPLIIIYLIVSLAFLIFYIVTLVKIMQRIKFSTNLRKSTADTVKKASVTIVIPFTSVLTTRAQVNKKIVLNGIVRVTSLIPIIVFIAPQIATVPVPQFIASVFIYVMIMLDSWARIYLFTEPTSKKKSDKGTKLAKNSSTTQQNTTSPRASSVDVANVGDNTAAETA